MYQIRNENVTKMYECWNFDTILSHFENEFCQYFDFSQIIFIFCEIFGYNFVSILICLTFCQFFCQFYVTTFFVTYLLHFFIHGTDIQ